MTQAGAVVFSREGLRCGRSTIPSYKMVSRRCTGAMQPRMLLIVALVALLASARKLVEVGLGFLRELVWGPYPEKRWLGKS